MRSLPFVCAATFLLTGSLLVRPAAAEPLPTGEWHTEDGLANIRIDDCNGALWGAISWEREPGGTDSNNPNPAERNHPSLGLHILRAMKQATPGHWQGEIYNPENGKSYDSKLSLTSADVLRVEGCVLGGLICGGQNWTRVKSEAPARAPARGAKREPAPAPPGVSACSGLPTSSR